MCGPVLTGRLCSVRVPPDVLLAFVANPSCHLLVSLSTVDGLHPDFLLSDAAVTVMIAVHDKVSHCLERSKGSG
jgi:hypothetical protein